ncbi:hypothetical protein Tgr7_0407 [Thioalkalivibrio sulfidiphilus HL-EbGr7]|uniref:Uncharacterized protein n=2 Tax=Thioalkalivibrio TaxID=106633 RepID=B8GUZ4_THISH|nr:hypothetical protein Tgr7_0407 [Thioalkalivibrio sulfidiphilus HL-EbGr7]
MITTPIQRALIDASQNIGCIAEMNGQATHALAARIAASGKALEDLTVGELLSLMGSTVQPGEDAVSG